MNRATNSSPSLLPLLSSPFRSHIPLTFPWVAAAGWVNYPFVNASVNDTHEWAQETTQQQPTSMHDARNCGIFGIFPLPLKKTGIQINFLSSAYLYFFPGISRLQLQLFAIDSPPSVVSAEQTFHPSHPPRSSHFHLARSGRKQNISNQQCKFRVQLR